MIQFRELSDYVRAKSETQQSALLLLGGAQRNPCIKFVTIRVIRG